MILFAVPPAGYVNPADRMSDVDLVLTVAFASGLLSAALLAGFLGAAGRMGARIIHDAQCARSGRRSRRAATPSG